MTDEPKRAEKLITSFADLADDFVRITVRIPRPDGIDLVIPMRTLSYSDWVAIEREFPLPQPPKMGADRMGRPITDETDPGYRRGLSDIADKRMYTRLLRALQVEVPGETDDEKRAALAALDTQIILSMRAVLETAHMAMIGAIEDRAESFRSDGDSNIPNL